MLPLLLSRNTHNTIRALWANVFIPMGEHIQPTNWWSTCNWLLLVTHPLVLLVQLASCVTTGILLVGRMTMSCVWWWALVLQESSMVEVALNQKLLWSFFHKGVNCCLLLLTGNWLADWSLPHGHLSLWHVQPQWHACTDGVAPQATASWACSLTHSWSLQVLHPGGHLLLLSSVCPSQCCCAVPVAGAFLSGCCPFYAPISCCDPINWNNFCYLCAVP